MITPKIAFFIPQIGGGGAERVVANLVNQFAKNGYSVILITKDVRPNGYVIANDVKRFCITEKDNNYPASLRTYNHIKNLRIICKSNNIDVVLSFLKPANYLATIATLGLRTKHIISVRNAPEFLYPTVSSRFFAKLFFPIADGAVFQTEEAKTWFPKRMQNKSSIIYNPIKEDFYSTDYKPEDLRIVTCGRLTRQKNHKMLINAFNIVTRLYPQAELHIYGDGNLKTELLSLIRDLNLENNVFLDGRVENVPQALAKATIFVLSSDVEGAPNALMEAMAVGLPSVSTDCPCGGPKMLLKNSGAGILVEKNNDRELADAIIKLLKTPALRNDMSDKAKKASNCFREEVVFKQWLDYIYKVCS